MTQTNSELQKVLDDESIEVGIKNYERITISIEKEGYRNGITKGRDSIFQKGFDNGYEDGFKIGFNLGTKQYPNNHEDIKNKCLICKDQTLLKLTERQVREMYDKE